MKSIFKMLAATAIIITVNMSYAGITTEEDSNLSAVLSIYLDIKNALVSSDAHIASAKANELLSAISEVKTDGMKPAEKSVWESTVKYITEEAEQIANTNDIEHQRSHFASLSKHLYKLTKSIAYKTTIYYQHCPMYNKGNGANWLSVDSIIHNPYYGKKMLNCGRTLETIRLRVSNYE